MYGLVSQLRRAALSVATNIVEGFARNSKNEFRRFLGIALSSLAETEYLLSFAERQKFISEKDYEDLMKLRNECGKYLWRLLQSQK